MSSISNIELSFRCPAQWSEMKAVPGGRFCESCKFVVHDFTNSTQAELEEAQRKNPGRVCGRYRASQMSTGFLQRAAVAAMAATALGACKHEPVLPVNSPESIKLEEFKMEPELHFLGITVTENQTAGSSYADYIKAHPISPKPRV